MGLQTYFLESQVDVASMLAILSNGSNLKHNFEQGDLVLPGNITIKFVKSFLRSYNKPERYYVYNIRRTGKVQVSDVQYAK